MQLFRNSKSEKIFLGIFIWGAIYTVFNIGLGLILNFLSKFISISFPSQAILFWIVIIGSTLVFIPIFKNFFKAAKDKTMNKNIQKNRFFIKTLSVAIIWWIIYDLSESIVDIINHFGRINMEKFTLNSWTLIIAIIIFMKSYKDFLESDK